MGEKIILYGRVLGQPHATKEESLERMAYGLMKGANLVTGGNDTLVLRSSIDLDKMREHDTKGGADSLVRVTLEYVDDHVAEAAEIEAEDEAQHEHLKGDND